MPTELDWAKLAAFIDGEGHIGAGHMMRRGKREHVVVTVAIANTDPRLVLWLNKTFGHASTRDYKAPHSEKRVYSWTDEVICQRRALKDKLRLLKTPPSMADAERIM